VDGWEVLVGTKNKIFAASVCQQETRSRKVSGHRTDEQAKEMKKALNVGCERCSGDLTPPKTKSNKADAKWGQWKKE